MTTIDDSGTQAHELRVDQAKQFIAASKVYVARTTTTTAQDKAQIKLLTQAVMVLVKHAFDEE